MFAAAFVEFGRVDTVPLAVVKENVRAGARARARFEHVAARDVAASLMRPGWSHESYRLSRDPDAHKVKQTLLRHVDAVTFLWRGPASANPFVVDLLLHGDLADSGAIAVRIPDLDLRKFLPQSVRLWSDDSALARLQAYFAEFARKAKIVRRAPGPSPLEREWLEQVREGVETAIAAASAGSGRATLVELLEELGRGERARLPRLEALLERALDDKRVSERARAALESARSPLRALSVGRRIERVVLINNCREPGNYEIALSDALGRPLLKSSFAIAPERYDALLRAHHGISIWAQGTGLAVPDVIAAGDDRYAAARWPWNWLKRRPPVQLSALRSLGGPAALPDPTAAGEIEVNRGAIPFWDSQDEVKRKSAFGTGGEPLSYVRVDPALALPVGFRAPGGMAPDDYWRSPAHAGALVPHRFQRFADLQRYQVYLSAFTPSGVYSGIGDLEEDWDPARERGRWPFDYSHLRGLRRFELREAGDGRFEIRLLSDSPGRRVGFVAGGFALRVGESREELLGIAVQPLSAEYDDDVSQDSPRYALAFDERGRVLDHHALDVGVERIAIERLSERALRVRLISHERIVPVWEGVLRLAPRAELAARVRGAAPRRSQRGRGR